jgi:trans-aconitate methyltransferase
MLIYGELAEWWPLFSHPKDYREEAEWLWAALAQAARGPVATMLELGSGGGNNALHLKNRCRLTLADVSPQMVEVSRRLNPECEHAVGDMRELRLARSFDAVFVHDAIMYMTTLEDLQAALATVAEHLVAGGIAVVQPDFVAETFRPCTDHGGHDAPDGRSLRYLAWTREPAAGNTVVEVDFAMLLREADGSTRTVHDRHLNGIFPRKAWRAAFREAGFANVAVEADPWEREVFFAVKG